MNKIFYCMAAILVSLAAPARAEMPHVLRACGDVSEFPPLQYFQRKAGEKTGEVVGFDVDVLRKIAASAGHEVQIDMLPWARCLALAARGQFDIAMDGIKSPLRTRDFEFAASHYTLTPVLVYLTAQPKPELGSREALARWRVCSQAEYNYEPYGVPNSMITNRARTIDDAATMLKLGRCSVMLQQIEVLRGHAFLGGVDLLGNPEFGHEVPRWMKPIDFYFMVGRKLAYRKEVLAMLDQGLANMTASGELERLRAANHLH